MIPTFRPRPPVAGFLCEPLGARLTRAACGTRHKNAKTPWKPGSRKTKVFSDTCAKCPIGSAHARGEHPGTWEGGAPIAELDLIPVQAILRSRPMRRKERLAAFR